MLEPRVTWLLAVRNGMPYLTETLRSIEAQTYKNWQILVWDNGSTDNTVEELDRWIPERLPGRVVSDCPFSSLGLSRAALVELAQTEFLALIDADDLSLPFRLEIQVAFLQNNPQVSVVGGQVEIIDPTSKHVGPYGFLPVAHDDIVNILSVWSPLAQPGVLFRRKAVLAVGNYVDVGSINVEDYDLWLRLACAHRLANVPEVVLQYRIHPRSTTVQALAEGKLTQAANECFFRHAGDLYGCSDAEARLLRTRSSRLAIIPLWKICRHLEETQQLPALARLRSPSFLEACRFLVSPKDWVTKLILALVEPSFRGKVRGIGYALEALLLASRLEAAASLLRKLGGRMIPHVPAQTLRPDAPEEMSKGHSTGPHPPFTE